MAKFHAQIWQFWKSALISATAACRAKMSSISTPWGRKRVYVQHLALWLMAKFADAQIWQFWKWARISGTAAHRAKISSISTHWDREGLYVQLLNFGQWPCCFSSRSLRPMGLLLALVWRENYKFRKFLLIGFLHSRFYSVQSVEMVRRI